MFATSSGVLRALSGRGRSQLSGPSPICRPFQVGPNRYFSDYLRLRRPQICAAWGDYENLTLNNN